MATDKCQSCKQEITSGWMLCRPCAIAKRTGHRYDGPCTQYVPEPMPKITTTCAECGYEHRRSR